MSGKHCKRCEGKTQTGARCKNKVSCEIGCHSYCHLHSKGYPHINVRCTTPPRRHEYEMTHKSPKKGRK